MGNIQMAVRILAGASPDELLRTVLEGLPAGAYLCDADGLITYYNERAVALWGRAPRLNDPADRFCGSFRLFSADGLPISHDQCWMALALRDGREYLGQPILIEQPDGRRRRAIAHASPLRDEDGAIVGAVNVLVDATSLAQTEERLNLLLNSIDDHFVQYDRQWRYTFVTDKGAAFVGRRREELIGRCIWELFPAAVGNLYYEKLQEAATTGRTVRFEHYYQPFDRWYDNFVYPAADSITVFSADITQRKKAEEALQLAEQRHSALLELVPAGVYRIDAAGMLRYYNRKAAELWGREPDLARNDERFCGSLRLFTVDGHAVPHDQCAMAAVVRNGQPVRNQEVMIERPDGSRITALVNIDPLFDDAGRITGAVNVFQDVTERKKAEAEAARSRRELATFIEHAAEGLHWVDENGIILWANAAELQMLGYAAGEYIGHSVREFHTDPAAIETILARLRAGETLRDHEAVLRCKDGSVRHVSITSNVMRDGERFLHTFCFTRDVTERRAQERALRESEARYRSLAEASGAIVFISNATGEWLLPQAAWARYTGQSFAQYRGRGWVAAIHPEDRPRIQSSVAAAIASGLPWRDKARVWHAPTAGYRHNEARAVPIRDTDGRIREWVGTCTDVHARTLAENRVHEADRRKDEFLAVLGHELRNPLAPIVSGLELLRLRDASPAQGPLLDILDRQVGHLVRLVDDLLEVSRITRGAIDLRPEPVALQDAVRAAVEISQPLIDAHGHRLRLRLPAEPLVVQADRVRLTQILANLLNNAAKYTPRGGRIEVEAEGGDDGHRVVVRDNGIGVPLESQEHVFELFRRGQGPLEGSAAGLGIGLALSRKLAQLHGGTIELSSPGAGLGSAFTLRLPPTAAALPAHAPAAVPAGGVQARRVLVVDDNDDAVTTLATLLRALGHEVRTARDGASALQQAQQFKPHVALLDLGMPPPDGFDLARTIREQPWGANVRLVAISGWGQDADRARSKASGFDLHLVKPVALEDVRQLLH